MAYREKIAPTRDGFQELWDSLQEPTIEMLMAGIQSRKTTAEQLLKITGEMRSSHTLLDKELYRLGALSRDYNEKWAPKKTYQYGVTEELQEKSQSQLKRWKIMLKITSPRCKSSHTNATDQSIYTASYLTHRPYELDMWGPASYGTLLYDLYDELTVLIDHLEDGRQMCQGVMQQENEINKDPEWKENLHDRQFLEIVEQNQCVIEKRYKQGVIDTDNRIYQKMVSSNSNLDFKSDGYHKYQEQEYVDYVVTVSTLRLQENKVSPKENMLLGDDFGMIKLLRFVICHLDELLKVHKNGKFDMYETLELIKWCKVKESTKKHEDSERVLFEHIKASYRGNHSWYGWTSIFTLNQKVKASVKECIDYSTRFERKLNRYLVDHGIKKEDITGESTQ